VSNLVRLKTLSDLLDPVSANKTNGPVYQRAHRTTTSDIQSGTGNSEVPMEINGQSCPCFVIRVFPRFYFVGRLNVSPCKPMEWWDFAFSQVVWTFGSCQISFPGRHKPRPPHLILEPPVLNLVKIFGCGLVRTGPWVGGRIFKYSALEDAELTACSDLPW
jgi:hypothetical protein